MTRQLQDRWC